MMIVDISVNMLWKRTSIHIYQEQSKQKIIELWVAPRLPGSYHCDRYDM